MRRTLLALTLCLPLAALAAGGSTDKINGDVSVGSGQHAGDVGTVNGDVHIASHASVRKASTVNGDVELADQAQAGELDTVNGAIHLGDGARVEGQVEAVNGAIRLAPGAEAGGHVSNVNGTIELDRAHAAAGLETVSGDITVGAGSHVEGGILVDQPHHGWFHTENTRKPVIVIGPHAVVQGTLAFHRPVVLKVSDSAQIGPVQGAMVEKFSGAAP